MPYYADFRKGVGFRCHACEIIRGPFWDDMAQDSFYEIEFKDVIEGTVSEGQYVCSVPVCHIFEEPIELVDLPKECYWGDWPPDIIVQSG